jgi:hypothetical protein
VDVPELISPCLSMAIMPIVSWLVGEIPRGCLSLIWLSVICFGLYGPQLVFGSGRTF